MLLTAQCKVHSINLKELGRPKQNQTLAMALVIKHLKESFIQSYSSKNPFLFFGISEPRKEHKNKTKQIFKISWQWLLI